MQGVWSPGMVVVQAAFALFGAFWGSWAVAAADVEAELGLSHGRFGLLLSAALGAAALANVFGGSLAERRGTGPVLTAALAGWAVVLVTGSVAALHPVAVGLAVAGVFAVGGLVDVVMNVAATAGLAGDPGALVRLHARFNAGAAVGAGAMALGIGAGASWRWAWVTAAVLAAALAVLARRTTLPAGDAGEHTSLRETLGTLRRERLVLVAAAFAIGAMVEGGVELWGVLFLRTTLPSGLLVAGTAAVLGYLVATAARLVFGGAAGRRGAARGVAAGAAATIAGILLLGLAPWAAVKGAGLVLAAGGVSMSWPLLLAQASAGRTRPGAVVGAVTAVGYTGLVLGPTVVGALAGVAGLRSGLLLLAVGAAFVGVAPTVADRRARTSRRPTSVHLGPGSA